MAKGKYRKVLFLNPSNTMPKDSARRLTTPLGFLYMGALLRDKGYDVKILDSPCEGYHKTSINGDYLTYGLSKEEISNRIKDYNPDIVGITSMFSAHQENAIDHCNLVKKINPDISVVLGGIHPSLAPKESIMNKSVDYVVIGEGEYRALNLLEALNKGETSLSFDGVAYKKNGEAIVNPLINRIKDLNALPQPARDMINMERYIQIGVPFGPFSKEDRVEQVMTSRGCPFDCVFCSTVNYWGHHFRTRSVDNIIEEIDDLTKNYGVKEIQFADDNLTAHKPRAKELFKRLKPYNLSWCTPNGLMIQTLDEEMIDLMAQSGAYQLTFAVESGNERVRKEIINKRVPSKEKVKSLIDICHDKGVQVHGLFIVGFPGEKREEMEDTFNYPYEVGFDSASLFLAHPMIGSRLHKICKEKGYLDSGVKGDLKHVAIKIPPTSADYIISPGELEKLVIEKTTAFNEYIKKKNPGAWESKFKQFLKRHGDKADLILGRVT
ncbi:B12-binding domain-containing radical SAM protein [Nanoarchaeota archaeon]